VVDTVDDVLPIISFGHRKYYGRRSPTCQS
jgi:hypothetical protein